MLRLAFPCNRLSCRSSWESRFFPKLRAALGFFVEDHRELSLVLGRDLEARSSVEKTSSG